MTGSWVKQTGITGLTARDTPQVIRHRGAHLLWSGWRYDPASPPPIYLRDLLLAYSLFAWQTLSASAVPAVYAPISSEGEWLYVVDTKVRRTKDYVTWEEVTQSVPFTLAGTNGYIADSQRIHKMGDKRILLHPDGSIWWTTDWLNWTQVSTPLGQRGAHVSVVYDGRFMVMAGARSVTNVPPEAGYPTLTSLSDAWSSTDPTNTNSWVCSEPPFDPRLWPAWVEHEGALWLTGGYSNQRGNNFNFNDTFRYTHAEGWKLVPVTATFTPVHGHALLSDDGTLYHLCGSNNPNGTIAEVWRFFPA